MAEEVTLYEKYGGFEFWHDCIYGLYLDMFDHPEISYHFLGVDMEWLSRRQAEFLVSHIGGPNLYDGPPIAVVHRHMGVTPFQFNEIAKAFADVFRSKGVEEPDVEEIMGWISSFKGGVVTEKTSRIDQIMIPIYRFFSKNFAKYLGKKNSWIRSGKIFNKVK